MDYQIDKSFIRDVKKAPLSIQREVAVILNDLKAASKISDLSKVKKLSGSKNAFRIRIDNFRMGFYLEDGVIVLSRLLSRKEIYRYFPRNR